jgi:hypothetical protein
LQGVVKKAVVADPPALDFGESLVSGEPFAARFVRVKALVPIEGLWAEVEPASLGITTVHRPQRNQYHIELNPNPELPVGPIRGEIRLTPTMPGGDALPRLVVPVTGHVVQAVVADPSSIVFGSRPVGATVEQTFTLRARDCCAFAIGEIASTLDGLRIVEVPAPVAGGHAFRATYVVGKPGRLVGEVGLTIRMADRAEFKVRVPVHCYGLPPS